VGCGLGAASLAARHAWALALPAGLALLALCTAADSGELPAIAVL